MLPSTMKVIEMNGTGTPEVLVVAQRPLPTVGPSEILIKVASAGINGPDLVQRRGHYPAPKGASDLLGLEVSGTVAAIGTDVSGWGLGDELCGLTNGGGYAEYVCIPQGQVLPVPSGLTLLQAAALPENYFTVWTNVFERGKLQAGEVFLVHGGSSGIGLTAIQLAKAFGAHVMCTVGNEEKMRACEAAGADLAINYRTQDFAKEVMDATDQKGVNIILDMVGGDYLQRNLSVLNKRGRHVSIAFLSGSKSPEPFDFGTAPKQFSLTRCCTHTRTQ